MKLVSIQITPSHISCCVVTQGESQQLRITACESTPFASLECEKLIIYNHTRLRSIIQNFIHKHNLKNSYTTLALTGPNIFEAMIAQPTAHPQLHDFSIARSKRHVWDRQFLYQHESGSYMFYVCGIPHTILLQYQLMMQGIDLKLVRITTRRMALLHAYAHTQGAAFRPAKLGIDMMQHNNMIEELFTQDLFHRLVSVRTEWITPQTVPDMLTACGLYVGENRD